MMTALAVLAGALATALMWGSPRRRPGPALRRPARESNRRPWWLAIPVAAAAVVAATWWDGARGAALATAIAIAFGTAGAVAARHRGANAAQRCSREVAGAVASMAVQLQVGLVASAALQNAAQDWPVLSEAAAALRLGDDPASCWRRQSARPGRHGLAELARAWRMCGDSGAPLAPALERVSAALEAEEALGLSVTTELAAARATGRIMAVLPLVGVGLGYALGGDPVHFLLDTTAGQGCLVGGTALAAAGLVWIERIAGGVVTQL